MINLHIQAENGADLRRQMLSFLGLGLSAGDGVALTSIAHPTQDDENPPETETPKPVAAPAKATRSRAAKQEEPSAPIATEQAGSTQTPNSDPGATGAEPEKPAAKPAAKVEPASDALSDRLIAAATNATAKLAADDYDFDRDTAPFIIATVKEKDPSFVFELLQSQFDVEKVSHLPDERHPEVLNALADKLAA